MDRALENLVWQRAEDRCEYCGMPQHLDPLPFEIDHIIPEFHHGPTIASNLCLSCFHDNRRKGTNLSGIDGKTRKLTQLFNPRRHSWSRHFKWDGPVLVGRTAIGRVTIDVLGINQHLRVWQRRELIEEGVFPVS
jgi:hypothetical protein